MIRNPSRNRWAKQNPPAWFFVRDAGEAEVFLVARVPSADGVANSAVAEVYSQIAETLCRRGLQIVQERIFGSLAVRNAVMATRANVFLAQGISPEGPVTYIQGNPPWGEGLSGVIIRAVSEVQLEEYQTIIDHGMPCGRMWRRNGVRSIVLQNRDGLSRSLSPTESATVQVRRMIEQADRILNEHGRSLHLGNIHGQIVTTLDKIEALLAQEKAGLQDFAAATIFLKRREDAPVFWKIMAHRGLQVFPAVCVVADVCREELLFEIDGEVVV